MKIAIFGGTFNPVHNGHIHLSKECLMRYSFDKILLIPTNLPPHKAAKGLISNEHRLNMLTLATENEDMFEVSDIEYRLGSKSYTINTINELKKQYKQAEFFLIAGSDMLLMFKKWHRYEDILKSVTLIVGARHEAEYERLLSFSQSFGELSQKIQIINIAPIDISSTLIRQKLANHESINELVNFRVEKYIKEHNLYNQEPI